MKTNLKNKCGEIHPLVIILLIVIAIIAISVFIFSNKTTPQGGNATIPESQRINKNNGEIPTLTLYNTATAQGNKAMAKTAISALMQAHDILIGKNIKPTDMSSEGLAKYYNEQMNCQVSDNKLLCVNGYEYIFNTDGTCNTSDTCSVIIDVNGEKGPNEEWTDPNTPKDRVKYTLVKEKNNGGFAIKMPDFFY